MAKLFGFLWIVVLASGLWGADVELPPLGSPSFLLKTKRVVVGELIETGSYSQVFAGWLGEKLQTVAIKQILWGEEEGLQEKRKESAQREYRNLQALQGNHYILHAYGFLEDPENHCSWLVMERGGIDLLQWINRYWNETDGIKYANDLIRIVDSLHRKGCMDLDLKPENVLMMEDGTLRICDTSFFLKGEVVGGKQRFFTPEYTPGEPVSIGSDYFGLGTTMWMLAFNASFWEFGKSKACMEMVNSEEKTSYLTYIQSPQYQGDYALLLENASDTERLLLGLLHPQADKRTLPLPSPEYDDWCSIL